MNRRRTRRLLTGIAGALVLLAGWLALGPAQLGGPASFAVIVGSSMEPQLHRGDLAVVRAGSEPQPGDVVLYQSAELGAQVLHRVLRTEGDRFVLKGDNNDFVDDARPTDSEIVGELWFSIPKVGRVTEWIREPTHAALLVGFASLFALGGFGTRRRRSASEAPAPAGGRRPLQPEPLLVGAAVAALVCLLLALVSFTRAGTHSETVPQAFVQQGKLDYSASVDRNQVYSDGRVETGDPIFLRLVPRLRFSFRYSLESEQLEAAEGRIGLQARLADGRGWERLFTLAAPRSFTGATTTVAGTLDLRRVQALIEEVGSLTGSAQSAYSLTILPVVAVRGIRSGAPLETTFAPSVGFDLGDLRLQPDLERGAEGVSPFAPREVGTGTQDVASTISLAALDLPVKTGRALSLIGLVASLLVGLLAFGTLRKREDGDEPARIEGRYSHLLLSVSSRSQPLGRVIELTDIESLVQLAEHHGRMILHLSENGVHTYVVEEGGSVYRYRSGAAPSEDAPPNEATPLEATPLEQAPAVEDNGVPAPRLRRRRLRPASRKEAPRR
ncbi:MAG TPA: signal peptidase I [Gaiellaceae bacterium]|nr:signal peptidase I [Gaiellaceae bacterium]